MGRVSRKIEQLKFAWYCFQRGNNSQFIGRVKNLDSEFEQVTLEKFGEKSSEDIIYFIDMKESHSGFFADHNRLLSLLYFADIYGLRPVVQYSSGYCYAEKHPVNGTENPFEYYFKQPGEISLEEMKQYKCVLRSRKENGNAVVPLKGGNGGYARSEEYINEMARITGKYIHLNDTISRQFEQEIGQLLDNKSVLAVHVRGTDFKQNFNGHPISVSAKEYLEETKKLFENGAYERVFLATDDAEALELFKAQFGEKLLYYKDVIRSDGNDTVMHSEIQRENHHYRLGVEVLRDMYTLASCNGLVAGLSQVSFAARIQKKSSGKDYTDLVVIDKGINLHGSRNCT